MGDKDLDVDQFRNPHESKTEWHLRRRFMLAHRDKFSVDRLLCLASCYVNVECYGNRYPDAVMRQLSELKVDLPHDGDENNSRTNFGKNELGKHRLSYQKRNEVKFVRSTDQTGSSTSTANLSSSSQQTRNTSECSETKHKQHTHIKLVRPSASSQTPPESNRTASQDTEELEKETASNDVKSAFQEELLAHKSNVPKQQASEQLDKFYALSNNIREVYNKGKNAIEALHMAVDKCKMVMNSLINMDLTGNYKCLVQINCINVSTGRAPGKKAAKHDAFKNAIDLLYKPHLYVDEEDPKEPWLVGLDKPLKKHRKRSHYDSLQTSDQPCKEEALQEGEQQGPANDQEEQDLPAEGMSRKRKLASPSMELCDFLIVEHQKTESAISVLHNSANINKQKIETEFLIHGLKSRCQLHLAGHLIADQIADTKAEAKTKAFEKGLEYLKTVCWTIRTKISDKTDEASVTRDELLGSIQSDLNTTKISESNIGNKLLKKMGWTGGGLGKEGNEGITEPVIAGDVISRAGLGLQAEQNISPKFLSHVRQLIQDYCQSGDIDKDLVFSPLFSKEERAIIHKEAQKMNLKSHSYGQGSERYLVLSRKRTVAELFSHILRNGGETSKYVLVPPSKRQT